MNAKKCKIICLILAMTLAIATPVAPQLQAAKKTKKLALNTKKKTLKVGKTLQLKVKNASKKQKKKLKWTTSNKKVATVSKKGKVKAKKAGKAIITAKIGKKKLKCKITVKKKKTTSKTTAVTKNTISSVKVLNGYTVQVQLSSAQKLAASNFNVKLKQYAQGTYNRTLMISEISTSDNKLYTITMDSESKIYNNYYILVTVTGLTGGTASKETVYSEGKFNFQSTSIFTANQNELVNREFYAEGYEYGYYTYSVTGLPKGITYKESDSGNYIKFSGKPSTSGKFVGKIVAKDELSNTYTYDMIWLVGSSSKILAEYRPMYGTLGTSGYSAEQSIKVIGGSESYIYEIQGDNPNNATVDTDGNISINVKTTGTHKVTVKVTDANDSSLSTTAVFTLTIAETYTISGVVKDAKGNAIINDDIKVDFINKNKASKYSLEAYSYTNSKGSYSVSLAKGTYDVVVICNDAVGTLTSFNVNGTKSGVDIRLPLYQVSILQPDVAAFVVNGYWTASNGKSYYISDDKLYLKTGKYTLTRSYTSGINSYKGEINVTVNASTTSVKPVVKVTSAADSVKGTIKLDTPVNVLVDENYVYYQFLPTESNVYSFYTESSSDTYGILYDANWNKMAENDDGGDSANFLIKEPLTEYETYYIGVRLYDADSKQSVKLCVKKGYSAE